MTSINNVNTMQLRGVIMEAVIKKWGNSLGIRIPKMIARNLSLKEGSSVEIAEEDNKVIIIPKKGIDLNILLEGINKSNMHEEVSVEGPIGNEIW